jgi:hypothetical protein
VSAAVSALVALLAWPVPVAPTRWQIGGSYNDHGSIAWTLHFVATRLTRGEPPWGHTDLLSFPEGATLFPADLPEMVLLTPVVAWLGATAAANVLAIVHHGLAAGLTFGWLRREGHRAPGAATGAVAVAFHGALVASTYNGNPDATPFYFVPAALWVAAALCGPSARPRAGLVSAILAGLLVTVAGLANPYVGVMAALALALRLAADRRLRDLGIALAVTAAGAAFVVAAITAALQAPDAAILKGPRPDLVGVASLVGLFRPSAWIVRTDPLWDVPQVATSAYLGLSLLCLAPFARRRTGFGVALLACGVVMALGPELALRDPSPGPPGSPPLPHASGLTLPWALAARLPGLGQLSITSRFSGLAVVGLGWLAAGAADRWGSRGWLVPPIVASDLLLFAGGAPLLGAAPVIDDGACAALHGLAPGAVVDLPPTFHELWLQGSICHRRSVAEGINRPVPPAAHRALNRSDAGPELARQGYRWLVVHRTLPGADRAPPLPCRVSSSTDAVDIYDLSCDPLTGP